MRVVDINRRFKTEVLFVTILRDGEVIIPNGNTVIYENDRLTLTGSTTQLERFFIKIGILSDRTVNGVMIVGGGRITYYLTSMLLELGMAVKIIELNKLAGEPIDVLVNGKYVAKGEVVVIEESFGVRITEIVNASRTGGK